LNYEYEWKYPNQVYQCWLINFRIRCLNPYMIRFFTLLHRAGRLGLAGCKISEHHDIW
jgi:hypothetical protein